MKLRWTNIKLGINIIRGDRSVLLWSKYCYSFQKGITYTTLPSLWFSTRSIFPFTFASPVTVNIVFLVCEKRSMHVHIVNSSSIYCKALATSTVSISRGVSPDKGIALTNLWVSRMSTQGIFIKCTFHTLCISLSAHVQSAKLHNRTWGIHVMYVPFWEYKIKGRE